MMSSEHDRFGELRRIQKREYERVVEQIASQYSVPNGASYSIYTDRSTMERKDPHNKNATIKGRPAI